MNLISRKSGLLNLFIFILAFNGLFNSLKANTNPIDASTDTFKKQEYLGSNYKEATTPYILDSGDIIYINFSGLEIFSGNYPISYDGSILVPELGKINIRGYTINQLRIELSEKYKSYIKDPKINVVLQAPRSLNISIIGEVKRPGLYELEAIFGKVPQTGSSGINQNSNTIIPANQIKFPRIFEALQTSVGITSKADLTDVIIRRNNPKIKGGGKVQTRLNLVALLNDGDQSQNIELRDGDSIIINKSDQPIFEQFLSINKTNISPESIRIYVNGNIKKPGSMVLPQNSSLYEAIAAAGGEVIYPGKIEFLRFNEEGRTEKRILPFKRSIPKGSKGNPLLADGDIIIVKKNFFGTLTSSISTIGSPIINAYGLYNLFD